MGAMRPSRSILSNRPGWGVGLGGGRFEAALQKPRRYVWKAALEGSGTEGRGVTAGGRRRGGSQGQLPEPVTEKGERRLRWMSWSAGPQASPLRPSRVPSGIGKGAPGRSSARRKQGISKRPLPEVGGAEPLEHALEDVWGEAKHDASIHAELNRTRPSSEQVGGGTALPPGRETEAPASHPSPRQGLRPAPPATPPVPSRERRAPAGRARGWRRPPGPRDSPRPRRE